MTDEPMPVPDAPHEQEEESHFWFVDGEYWPVDRHAVYGHPSDDQLPDDDTVPVRNALREPQQAIRSLREGDKVRVNGGGWMDVVGTDLGAPVVVYENGSVEYQLWDHHTPEKMNILEGPRMFRADPFRSAGYVECIEVVWRDREPRTSRRQPDERRPSVEP